MFPAHITCTPEGPLSGAGIRCGTSNFAKKRPTFFVDLIDGLDANCNVLQAKTIPRHTGLFHAEEADAAEVIGLAADVMILEGERL